MSAHDGDEMSVPTNRTEQAPNAPGDSLHGDMSTGTAATGGQNDGPQAAPMDVEPEMDAGSGLNAPDDDTLGTLTTGGTGGTTGSVSGTAEATFEGAGRSYGDPDTVRDD